MHPPDTERQSRSPIRQAAPGIKLVAAVLLVTLTALLPRHLTELYLVPTVILLVLWPVCRMPISYGLRRLLVAELFIVGIGLLTLLHPAGAPIFLSTMFKSNLCVLAMLLLTWTTPFHEVLAELRRWHFPTVMLSTLALMYRYLPVLGEETRRMTRARASRTFSSKRVISWQNVALIIGQLFVRSADRAEKIYLAMCARGWK
jgi:cobalt/nickel transport system permease protein